MSVLPQITFRHMESSPAAEATIASEVEHLARLSPGLESCAVVVEEPHRHQQRGRRFHVTVRASFAGTQVVTSRDPGPDDAHDDLHVAVRDAFRALRRALTSHNDEHDARRA